MNRLALAGIAALASLASFASPLHAQVLHVNDTWDNCAIVIDPALTQQAWRQFVTEAGLVTYFRPLTGAKPLGRGHFEVAALSWGTMIDDADPAWNDTFSHPDSTHWLFDGNALMIPGLMLRLGVSQRFDVGAYWTTAPNSNYGMLGGQVQYALLNEPDGPLSASGRVSGVKLYGPADMDVSTLGLDFIVSREISRFSPYAAVGGYWSRGRETTDKVDLREESVVGVQGTVGVAARIWLVRLGTEFNLAKVSGYSFKVAFGS
jgi:hypothetical protein